MPRICRSTTLNTKATDKTSTTTGSLRKDQVTYTLRPRLSSVFKRSIVLELPPAPAARALCGFSASFCAARRLRECRNVPHHTRVTAGKSSKLRLRKGLMTSRRRLCKRRATTHHSNQRCGTMADKREPPRHVAFCWLLLQCDEGRQIEGAPQEDGCQCAMRGRVCGCSCVLGELE